jgi:hypothetical protein
VCGSCSLGRVHSRVRMSDHDSSGKGMCQQGLRARKWHPDRHRPTKRGYELESGFHRSAWGGIDVEAGHEAGRCEREEKRLVRVKAVEEAGSFW